MAIGQKWFLLLITPTNQLVTRPELVGRVSNRNNLLQLVFVLTIMEL